MSREMKTGGKNPKNKPAPALENDAFLENRSSVSGGRGFFGRGFVL